MKLAVIGFGNAGGKIADELLRFEQDTGRTLIRSMIAVNSAIVDLERLENIPEENKFLIGQTDPRVKGHGVGGDPDLGAEITRQDKYEIDRALDQVPVYDIDAFLIVAGFGGGTGSGGGPVMARTINERFDEPVYGLGVLPSSAESGRASLNAARSFKMFAEATTNCILFDNDDWRSSGDSVEAGYGKTNAEMAKRIVTLLAAGEVDGSRISENAMDSSDIRRTLATGGASTIAYAETTNISSNEKGLLSRFRTNGTNNSNGADQATKVKGLIRQAVQSRLTCDAEISSAERSLIVVSGPPSEFSLKGLESGRRWLEETTESVEVLAGDDPRPGSDTLSAVILLSNVTEITGVEQLQEQAVAAKENISEQESTRTDDIQSLITDEQDELERI